MREFVFDPRVFIQPPYITCPNCGTENAFGVLMIGWGYTRRCRECWHTERFDLPEIRKTVIYLDQLAISEMMKALNPAVRAHGRVDAFWLELFERLDVLSKLQLIVCPDSDTHRDESAVAPHPEALKRMYELLSHGISFDSHMHIRDDQLIEHLKAWLDGEPDRPLELDVERVTHGTIHAWQERFYITVGGLEPEDRVDEMRAARERGSAGLERLFERWQGERELSFDDFRRRELFGSGESMLEQHVRSLEERARAFASGELTVEHLMPSSASLLCEGIHHVMRERGVPEEQLWAKTRVFLRSESLTKVPYLNIASYLFAAMARQVAHGGRRRPPNRGWLNDVRTVATVMPYCDALFVDNEVAGFLREEPLRTRLDYGTRVFAPNRRNEFVAYLDELRVGAREEHLRLVEEVYGADWATPFTTVFARELGLEQTGVRPPSREHP
jgi:hypothetical protein